MSFFSNLNTSPSTTVTVCTNIVSTEMTHRLFAYKNTLIAWKTMLTDCLENVM